MKNEFFASVILLAIFICCTAWYRGAPSSSKSVKKEKTEQHCEALSK